MIVVRFTLATRPLEITVNCTGPLANPSASVTIAVIRKALHAWIDKLTPDELHKYTVITEAAILADVEDPK